MADLHFCTTQELIEELLRRQTFCGAIVHSADDNRQDTWPEERIFKVSHSRNLESAQVGRLLDVVAEHLQLGLE